MAYRKDPRENIIDLDKHAIWEQDNRVEARYVWNGAVLDLCDMTPEEYMKNPIIEAIMSSSGGGSHSTEEIIDAINEMGEKIIKNDDENTDEILSAITGGGVETQVTYYFTSVNNTVKPEDLTINDFVMNATNVGSDTYFHYTLGDPSSENWNKFINKEITEEELRRLSCNSYYLMIPKAYGINKKFTIFEEGTIDVTNEFEMVNNTIIDTHTLFKSVDIDYFNIDYPNQKNVQITYKLKIIK